MASNSLKPLNMITNIINHVMETQKLLGVFVVMRTKMATKREYRSGPYTAQCSRLLSTLREENEYRIKTQILCRKPNDGNSGETLKSSWEGGREDEIERDSC